MIRGGERRGKDEEMEISREEIREAIGNLRVRKAAGRDEVPDEVWKYGGEEVEEWVWRYCNGVWKGGGWPEEWKEGVIIPIVKKGEGERVEEYRRVTLMPTLYKIYAMILAGRLKRDLEEKGTMPHNQTGFRKGMGVIDNIYVLNYLVNRQVEKKGGKLVAMFVNLKAAFDSVDRGILGEAMRDREVREGLVIRTEEIMREVISRLRIGRETGEGFWTARGVRQGCPLPDNF